MSFHYHVLCNLFLLRETISWDYFAISIRSTCDFLFSDGSLSFHAFENSYAWFWLLKLQFQNPLTGPEFLSAESRSRLVHLHHHRDEDLLPGHSVHLGAILGQTCWCRSWRHPWVLQASHYLHWSAWLLFHSLPYQSLPAWSYLLYHDWWQAKVAVSLVPVEDTATKFTVASGAKLQQSLKLGSAQVHQRCWNPWHNASNVAKSGTCNTDPRPRKTSAKVQSPEFELKVQSPEFELKGDSCCCDQR